MKGKFAPFYIVALVICVLAGALAGCDKGSEKTVQPPPAAQAPALGGNLPQQVRMLEEVAAKEPGNRNVWVELGHAYFDLHQPVKSIEAYDKALAIDPNDPNVLTDQGVMFRSLGWYDRAIANFNKAQSLDPSHQQSLYNLGVVYRYDLQDFAKAQEAWTKFITQFPTGPGADQARAELQRMQVSQGMPTGPAPQAK